MLKETIIAMTVVTVAAGAAVPAMATDTASKPIVVAACNPCNPCASKGNPCNPCNPCAAKGNPCNPCNPCAAKKQN